MIMENKRVAIREFKKRLTERFGEQTEAYLFGSEARGDYGTYSDIDILVLLSFEPTSDVEEQIFDLGYDVALECGVVFGIIVYSKSFWRSEIAHSMPLYKSIQREGVGV